MDKQQEHRYLPSYSEQMRILQAERPKVLWHWEHKPYRDLRLRREKIMEINYSDDVKLVVNITDEMVQDWKDCQVEASKVHTDGKDCAICSLGVDIENNTGLCELPVVREELERRTQDGRK